MNILHDISIKALRRLIDKAKPGLAIHNIVVDYDGEVIIDPEFKFANVGINRYKYCTRISNMTKANDDTMTGLLENLLNAFNKTSFNVLAG